MACLTHEFITHRIIMLFVTSRPPTTVLRPFFQTNELNKSSSHLRLTGLQNSHTDSFSWVTLQHFQVNYSSTNSDPERSPVLIHPWHECHGDWWWMFQSKSTKTVGNELRRVDLPDNMGSHHAMLCVVKLVMLCWYWYTMTTADVSTSGLYCKRNCTKLIFMKSSVNSKLLHTKYPVLV